MAHYAVIRWTKVNPFTEEATLVVRTTKGFPSRTLAEREAAAWQESLGAETRIFELVGRRYPDWTWTEEEPELAS